MDLDGQRRRSDRRLDRPRRSGRGRRGRGAHDLRHRDADGLGHPRAEQPGDKRRERRAHAVDCARVLSRGRHQGGGLPRRAHLLGPAAAGLRRSAEARGARLPGGRARLSSVRQVKGGQPGKQLLGRLRAL